MGSKGFGGGFEGWKRGGAGEIFQSNRRRTITTVLLLGEVSLRSVSRLKLLGFANLMTLGPSSAHWLLRCCGWHIRCCSWHVYVLSSLSRWPLVSRRCLNLVLDGRPSRANALILSNALVIRGHGRSELAQGQDCVRISKVSPPPPEPNYSAWFEDL